MALDMFIKFDGMTGSSQDKAQKGNSDVLAYSWGMSQSGSFHTGSGGGAGKVNIQDLSFTKYLDDSTTALMMHCCTGKHIPKVVMLIRKAGGELGKPGDKEVEITMTKVMVTSVSTGGSGGEDKFTENVTLNFAEIKFENFKQDAKGVVSTAGNLDWNIAENAGK
ncbi:Hcp family type VI secretion system effector [Massilia sp. TWP1-3-3]|uniref:Hcp family type VI secretion system effector n=1 Tax=Massilia sp. TWP1-3-3 TaxID=2804573 RepID=UPI003CE8756B